jgi:hypothetical protein
MFFLSFSHLNHEPFTYFEMKKQLTKSTTTPCNIWEVKALTMSDCNNKGTDDHEDDNFKIDALVEFVGDIPTTGNLVLVGTIDNAPPVIKSVPVQNLTQGSWNCQLW